MSVSYYPWNVSALSQWLVHERLRYPDISSLAKNIGIPQFMLLGWMQGQKRDITFEHIQAIATYRDWSCQQVIDWLQIASAHWWALRETSLKLA